MNTKFLTGRISRGGYFASLFGVMFLVQLLGGLTEVLEFSIPDFLWDFIGLAFLLMVLVLSIKRFHDINISVISAIPWVGLALGLIISAGFIPVVGYMFAPMMFFLMILLLSLKKGTVGPNKYGEDPVYRKITPTT